VKFITTNLLASSYVGVLHFAQSNLCRISNNQTWDCSIFHMWWCVHAQAWYCDNDYIRTRADYI